MVKSDIVTALYEKGYYKQQASDIIDEVFRIISDAMAGGEPVQIRGFGTFGIKIRKGRVSRDISTGEMRTTEDCKVPAFRASDRLKSAVRSGGPSSEQEEAAPS